jgi:hypothetical protein
MTHSHALGMPEKYSASHDTSMKRVTVALPYSLQTTASSWVRKNKFRYIFYEPVQLTFVGRLSPVTTYSRRGGRHAEPWRENGAKARTSRYRGNAEAVL